MSYSDDELETKEEVEEEDDVEEIDAEEDFDDELGDDALEVELLEEDDEDFPLMEDGEY